MYVFVRHQMLIEVPICMDTGMRKEWIREWPRPSALPYQLQHVDTSSPLAIQLAEETLANQPVLNFQCADQIQSCTCAGPLFRHSFAVKLSAINGAKLLIC
jgi:hypothetical protein